MRQSSTIAACVAALALGAISPAAAAIDVDAVARAAAAPVQPNGAPNLIEKNVSPEGYTGFRVTRSDMGLKYILLIDGCADVAGGKKDCARLGFIIIYNQNAGDFSLETLNAWNANRPPQAFKDEGANTYMIHYVLAPGGVTPENLAFNFNFWNDAVANFNNYLAAADSSVAISAKADGPKDESKIAASLTPGAAAGQYDHAAFADLALQSGAQNEALGR